MFVHAFMLRRPSPSLLCSVYRNSTEKIFVIKKFIFSFHPETDKEKKEATTSEKLEMEKDENMFSSHEDIRQQIRLKLYVKQKNGGSIGLFLVDL